MAPKPPSCLRETRLGVFLVTGTLPTINEESEEEDVVMFDTETELARRLPTYHAKLLNLIEDHDKEEFPEDAGQIEYDENAEDVLDQEDAECDWLENEQLETL